MIQCRYGGPDKTRGPRLEKRSFWFEGYHYWMKRMLRVFLLILICLVGCKGKVALPQHLTGVWVCSAPQYADRYMKFSEHTLTYGIGEGKEVSHEIEKIKVKQGDGGTIYTFYYRDSEGEKWTLALTYRPDAGGTIQIKNSEGIWEKAKGRVPQ